MSTPKGPFHLVTVNTAPERAKRLIGRLVEALKDQYTIVHVDNCESKYTKPKARFNQLTKNRDRRGRGQGQAAQP
jgi:hypothetical protein